MEMSGSSEGHQRVKLNNVGALIAALPWLLGFHPADSFLMVTIRTNGQLGFTTRSDLVPPRLHATLLAQLTRSARRPDVTAAVLVGVCDASDPAHDDLLHRAAFALESIGVRVLHAVWTSSAAGGTSWRCPLHEQCEGQVPDPSSSELAAAMTYAGAVTLNSRDDLVRLLETRNPERTINLSSQLDVAVRTDAATAEEHLSLVRSAVETGTLPTTDKEFVRLALALADHRVRDACMAFTVDARADSAAERLWIELIRFLPPPERAEPCVLLAIAAYLRGDGALTNIALGEALIANPAHQLATYVRGAIDAGVTPARMRRVVSRATSDAHTEVYRHHDTSD